MITPPDFGRLPFKKIRSAFRSLREYLWRTRPIEGGGLELTAAGMRVNFRAGGASYTPPLARIIVADGEGKALQISKGWLRGPSDPGDSTQAAPGRLQKMFKPNIAETAIDADPPPQLAMLVPGVNRVYIEIGWGARVRNIGKRAVVGGEAVSVYTEDAASNIGVAVEDYTGGQMPNHNHPSTVTDLMHQHEAWVFLNQAYHHIASVNFVVYSSASGTTEAPDDGPYQSFLEAGVLEFDADGALIVDDWGLDHNVSIAPQTFIQSGTSIEVNNPLPV